MTLTPKCNNCSYSFKLSETKVRYNRPYMEFPCPKCNHINWEQMRDFKVVGK